MANHQSSVTTLRQTHTRNSRNLYYANTTRNAARNLRKIEDKAEAAEALKKVSSMLDKLAIRHTISKNKAANLKSKLALHVNKLNAEA